MRTAESPGRLLVHRLAWCALLLFLISTLASAERLPLKPYTTADGLPHNAINKIVRDSRGFLWFCTNEGLSRYDGYTFTNYGVEQGLPHRAVNDFLETRSGEIWVATNAGLARFDPKGVPTNLIVYANQAIPDRPAMFTVIVPQDEDRNARAFTVLLEGRDGTIWCGTMKYLYRLDRREGRFELRPADLGVLGQYPQQVYALDLLEDRHGSLWIGSFNGLLRRRPDGRTDQYTISFNWKENGLPDLGLGAEDVAQVAPSFVFTDEGGEARGVKYERLNVLLINAVKEQQAQIQQQQEMIKQQQALGQRQQREIAALKKLICQSQPRTKTCR